MAFHLYRLARPTDDFSNGQPLGSFEVFDDALAARDVDTIELFAQTNAGQVLYAHHLILGPGPVGTSAHPVSTAIERAAVSVADEVAEARDWLDAIHARSSTR